MHVMLKYHVAKKYTYHDCCNATINIMYKHKYIVCYKAILPENMNIIACCNIMLNELL